MSEKSVISLQVPTVVDAYLESESRRMLTSKSAVVRGILAEHLRSLGIDVDRMVPGRLAGGPEPQSDAGEAPKEIAA